MIEKITIKPVNHHSFPRFIELIHELAIYEDQTPPDKLAQQRLKKDSLGPSPKFEAYLAYHQNKPIGYLIIYFTYSSFLAKPTLYIEDFYIQENQRRRGFGQELFDFCKTIAADRNCGRMEWNVYTWNTPAIKFYEKNKAILLDKVLYQFNDKSFHHL